MKNYKHKAGFTLVEMLIVVAIVAILTSIAIGIAARIDNQGKERLTENTFAIINAALGQFHDYGYQYKHVDYSGLSFPLDCNDFLYTDIEVTLLNALGAATVSIIGGTHNPVYSGSEALYFFLSRVPECRKTLAKIDRSLITNEDSDGREMKIVVGTKDYPLFRIIDPWGKTLHYDYYNERASTVALRNDSKRTFPVITSAGPDKKFGAGDDVSSR